MVRTPLLSYSQRGEDLYLARCFPDRTDGFYIDVGSGHPVYDNVSFAFYLRGWRGITVEPNPALAALGRAVRPRDHLYEGLAGASAGEGTFYCVHDFHGFSTAVADHAKSAFTIYGKDAEAVRVPATTLTALCEQHAGNTIDFLKIDVEGFESEVIRGADWRKFRPKVVLVEALAPFTQVPAWEEWEPVLAESGYRFAFFDSLNRYYVAEEAAALARYFETAPEKFDDAVLFRDTGPALEDRLHPDQALANLVARATMTRLPLLDPALLLDLVTLTIAPGEAERPATAVDFIACWQRLFGAPPDAEAIAVNPVPVGASVRDIYAALLDTDRFRAACGRISASYAW